MFLPSLVRLIWIVLYAVTQTVLVIKYVIPSYPENFGVSWGVANVIQSSQFSLYLPVTVLLLASRTSLY